MLDKLTITGDSMQMAMIVLLTIPVLFLFPFVQKHFVKGINIGSTKSKGDETMTTILQLSDLHIGHTTMKKIKNLRFNII